MINFKFKISALPPSVNQMYHPKFTQKKGLHIKKDPKANLFAHIAYNDIKIPDEPFDSKMDISLCFKFESDNKLKRSDVDNMLKCLFDSLQEIGVIENDNLIYRISNIEKKKGKKDEVIGHITDYKK